MKGISMHKNKFDLYYERAKLSFDYSECQLLIEDVDTALKFYTDDAIYFDYKIEMYELKMLAYYRLEDYDNTLKLADLILELAYSKQAYLVKSLIHEKRKEYKDAISTIRQMLEEKLSNDPYRENSRIALAYYNSGEYQESINEFKKCLELAKDTTSLSQTYGCMGEAYENLRQLDLAETAFKNKLNTLVNEDSYNSLAWFYYESRKDYDKALNYADKALICNPKYTSALDTRANIYNDTGEHEKALADINYALELKPETTYYKTRAKIYENLNEPDKAKEDLLKVKI